MPDVRTRLRPLLKWAGGKRQLLPELRPFYPARFPRYLEPFLGSGAVFLDLHNLGLLDGREVWLSDINADVVGCYLAVRGHVEAVIGALRRHERDYRTGGGAHFYKVRDDEFNPARRDVHASADPAAAYTADLSAMLIFLNRTGFNGLFRLNGKGAFNVPHGRNANPRICDEDNLRAWSALLRRRGLHLEACGFESALTRAGRNDFVYLDPPYAPLSATARFTSYTAGGFGADEQKRLQREVLRLTARGASVLLSNSAAPQIRALYARDRRALKAGLQASTVAARRAINSRASSRGPIREYLITNVKPSL
ncbi:MAG TPA: Dam family site-specific DNA-(adenine-N6)-methyltransferase [Vicinamibacterales bacterium]|jgi:DNA adenine methylase